MTHERTTRSRRENGVTLPLLALVAVGVLLAAGCERRKTVSKDPDVETQQAPLPDQRRANANAKDADKNDADSGQGGDGSGAATTAGANKPRPQIGPENQGIDKPSQLELSDDGTARTTMVVSDQIAYNRYRLEVPAGAQTIELTIEHRGKLPASAMGHNIVILEPSTDPQAVAQAATTAKDDGYIPAKYSDAIIAHTKMVGGGESDTVSFPAPKEGSCTYICTFPGHAAVMQGTLVVGGGGS